MIRRLSEVLAGQGENYILPFFWQHGETEEVLREYMGAIQNCGIGAVCVECRPHPDFCGEQWWHDMDIILDEARTRGMKVWILDDAHFPTGQANGAMENAPAELCKQYLNFQEVDLLGPTPAVTVDVTRFLRYVPRPGGGMFATRTPKRLFDDESLLCVVAAKALDKGVDAATLVDLTGQVKEGILTWDVPDGAWRVFVIFRTRNGGGATNYINMISLPSCKVQLDAVYEPHWEHYAADFGKTIAGFFSDEPCLGNLDGYDLDNWIGKKMPLPWSEEAEQLLQERWGDTFRTQLSLLWFPDTAGSASAYARYVYMDVLTALIERDFSMQIGDWCAAHGVKYIGHTIEDTNEHSHLGQSMGHQFRGVGGQHMGGIDDIGGQVNFGTQRANLPARVTGQEPGSDGEFYHFMLGRLGSSAGLLDPRKNGDSMCEIFGAYGWSEGTRLQKYLADHFLVRGINHYVPHAFSPKEFPDTDCPPHYYAHGLNPLYEGFGVLMRYLNRMCHLLSGGIHRAPAAVLYHAEAEWTSREEGYLQDQIPMRILAEHQIDCDLIWTDVLADRKRFGVELTKTCLRAGRSEFRFLLVPYSYYTISAQADFLAEVVRVGFPVAFVGGRPQAIADKPGAPLPEEFSSIPVVSLEELPAYAAQFADTRLDAEMPWLRSFHYVQESDLYMLSNESLAETFDGFVRLDGVGTPVVYDALSNELLPVQMADGALRLRLEPFQSMVVLFGHEAEAIPQADYGDSVLSLQGWSVRYKHALHQAEGWSAPEQWTELRSPAQAHPDFSGWLAYETTFSLPEGVTEALLRFENAYEVVSVQVNGQNVGIRICPPYEFRLKGLHSGENRLSVTVATTLERAVMALPEDPNTPPMFSRKTGIGYPYGLVGAATLRFRK